MSLLSDVKLTRRQSLLALTYAAAGGSLVLTGCGSGSSRKNGGAASLDPASTAGWQTGLISGRVSLPSVTPGKAAQYHVRTAVGSAPVNADGTFQVLGFVASPAMARVLDGTGQLNGLAFIAPNDAQINAAQVARTLAYIAMKGQLLPAENRLTLWNALSSQPEVAALAADIDNVKGPLTISAPAVKASVTTHIGALLSSINGGGGTGRAARLAAIRPARTAAQNVSTSDAALSQPLRGKSRGLRIQPTQGTSNISVQEQGLNEIVIVNYARRRCWAYVHRIESTLSTGKVEPRNEYIADFSVDAVSGIASIAAEAQDVGTVLGDASVSGNNAAFTGNVAGVATQTTPLALPLFPADAKATKYRVFVVGPGSKAHAPADLTKAMQDKQASLLQDSIFLDFFMPLALSLAGPIAEKISHSKQDEEELKLIFKGSKDFLSTLLGSAVIQAKLDNQDYLGAIADAENIVLTSDAGKAALGAGMGALLTKLSQRVVKPEDIAFDKALSEIADIMDFGLLAADLGLIVGFWLKSNAYERFIVDAVKGRVLLKPQAGVLSVLGSLDLTATVPDATGAEAPLVTYKWTLLSGTGVQLTNGANTGTAFTASAGPVTLQSTTHDTGTATVQVEAILNNLGNTPNQSLGTATATVEIINDKATLTPANASIAPNGQQAYTVTIKDPSAGSKYLYKWSTSGSVGTLDIGKELTAHASAVYHAGNAQGSDTVSVDVYENNNAGPIRIGSATASIKVSDQPTVVPGTFKVDLKYSGEGDNARVYASAVVVFSPVAGAKSYTLNGTGGNDPLSYGSRIQITAAAPVKATLFDGSTLDNAFGLAGGGGPADRDFTAYYNSRFGGFTFTVTANL